MLQVDYFDFLGGYTLMESVKFAMKAAFTDSTLRLYSLWGEKDDNRPLAKTRILSAIFGMYSRNKNS